MRVWGRSWIVSAILLSCLAGPASRGDTPSPQITDLKEGEGAEVSFGDEIEFQFSAKVAGTNTVYGGEKTFKQEVGKISLKGLNQAVVGMKPGGQRKVVLPPELAYGDKPGANGQIPPHSTLEVTLQLVSVHPANTEAKVNELVEAYGREMSENLLRSFHLDTKKMADAEVDQQIRNSIRRVSPNRDSAAIAELLADILVGQAAKKAAADGLGHANKVLAAPAFKAELGKAFSTYLRTALEDTTVTAESRLEKLGAIHDELPSLAKDIAQRARKLSSRALVNNLVEETITQALNSAGGGKRVNLDSIARASLLRSFGNSFDEHPALNALLGTSPKSQQLADRSPAPSAPEPQRAPSSTAAPAAAAEPPPAPATPVPRVLYDSDIVVQKNSPQHLPFELQGEHKVRVMIRGVKDTANGFGVRLLPADDADTIVAGGLKRDVSTNGVFSVLVSNTRNIYRPIVVHVTVIADAP